MVDVVEVALRDGLQNEETILSTEEKIKLAEALIAAGARRIEAVSFAHPKLVPAMADAEAVMAGVPRRPGLRYSGLVLNDRGLDRALACDLDEINVVVCASDTFSRRNQNVGRVEAGDAAVRILERARANGLFVTLTVATAFGCPFEGEVAVANVVEVITWGVAAGAHEICIADTIGVGVPSQVADLARRTREVAGDDLRLRFHFHNTRNTGYVNAWEAVRTGADALDASVGGIGGCPFAPNATGNIATEDLGYLLERAGVPTGLDLPRLVEAADFVGVALEKPVPALLGRAGIFRRADRIAVG